jgi:hypothetical protein
MTFAACSAEADQTKEANAKLQGGASNIARLRPRELHRLIQARYGGLIISDDDNGEALWLAMLDSLAALGGDPDEHMTEFLMWQCPWMTTEQRENAKQDAITARRFWSASTLGDALKLTWEERNRLKITTIRPSGVGDAELAAAKAQRKAAIKKAKQESARLHPKPKPSKPALRLDAILKILAKPGEWVAIKAVSAELTRRKVIHFVTFRGQNLTTAVHDAVKLGLKERVLDKRFVDGPKFKVAQICRRQAD